MKIIKYFSIALYCICNCFAVNALAADSYFPDARLYYTFDADSITYHDDGNYIIADYSPNEHNITVSTENIKLENDYASGSFTIPAEFFSDTTDFTLNFWYEADPANGGYGSSPMVRFGPVSLFGMSGSGRILLCSYSENDNLVYARGMTSNIDIEKPNMYTLIKTGDMITMYLNGDTIDTRLYGNCQSTVNFCDIAADGAAFEVSGYIIDEFVFYNTALTNTEIMDLYEKTSAKIEDIHPAYPYIIGEMSLLSVSGEVLTDIPNDSDFIVETALNEVQERSAKDYLFVAAYGNNGQLLSLDYVKADFIQNSDCSFGFNIPAQSEPIKETNY